MTTITPGPRDADGEVLLRRLGRELSQTESSAARHCRREAAHLGDVPPARPLREAAEHARLTLRELRGRPDLADLRVSPLGRATGLVFSYVRDTVVDRFMLDLERSYRGTLLGLRHGIDVVLLIRHVADELDAAPVLEFCERWLTIREPLVDKVEDELAWLARHPARALGAATSLPALVRARLRHT